jgi:hypothetical protein
MYTYMNGFYMPPSVHKILIHRPYIVASFFLPIGQLSEEAQESRNKNIKKYREHFTRKSSRIETEIYLIGCCYRQIRR